MAQNLCDFIVRHPDASVILAIGTVVSLFISVIWQITALHGTPKTKRKGEFYGEYD